MIILLIALAVATLILVGWLYWQLAALRHRFTAALGSHSGSLEASLAANLKAITVAETKLAELTKAQHHLGERLGLAAQKVAITRFNPFGDTGGEQSFCLAVLDAHNSGYVLTSIHGREGTRVYAKPIDYGNCKYSLSAEEEKALKLATQRVIKEGS